MSILIRGIEMPKNCRECFACKAELSQEKKVIYVCCFAQTDCPLIPVPPHGRLKDADALLKKCEFVCTDDAEDVRAVRCSVIDAAPTIIPADELNRKNRQTSTMDSFIRIFEEDDEEDGMDSFIRILKD